MRLSSQVTAKVMTTAKRMAPVSSRAREKEPKVWEKNRVKRVMIRGKRPLQGIKLLVRMASRRSLGESMIRQPTTPAALQPRPMHMLRACLPQPWHRAKGRSNKKATRGRYPTSSSNVNRGKNTAMGGSITAQTQAVVR